MRPSNDCEHDIGKKPQKDGFNEDSEGQKK